MKWLKENFSSLIKVCIIVIAFLMPILLLVFVWVNYFHSHNQINELISVLQNTTQQNINIESLTQYLDSNLQFNFNVFISIIDIVIAVWLGLNIYNVLSKNEISILKEKMQSLLDDFDIKSKDIDDKIFTIDKTLLIAGEKDLHRKVEYCKEILKRTPQKREIHNLLGNQYYFAGNYSSALQNYKNAISVSNDYYFEAEFNCSECLIKTGLYDDAIERINKILIYNSFDFEVYLIMAEAHRRKGDFANAIKYNEEAERLANDNYYVLNMYGSIYFDMGQLNDAEGYFKQTLSKMPDLEEAHYYLAEIYKNTDPTQSQHHRDLAHGYVPDKP